MSKIIISISSLSLKSGGPTQSTYFTAKNLHEIGCDVKLIAEESQESIANDDFIEYVPKASTPFFSKNYKKAIAGEQAALYHIQGLWLYNSICTAKTALRKNLPYIISPRGMLYPQALNRKRIKKQIFLHLGYKKLILKANCLHATCFEEMQHIRAFGYKGPVAIIPNPVAIPENLPEIQEKTGKNIFIFLGRLHNIKRIEQLLYASAQIPDKSRFELHIIGSGDENYTNFLKKEAEKLSLPNVKFVKFLEGEEKYAYLAKSSALFLPSEMENFGIVVIESLLAGTPAAANITTPWADLNAYKCGWHEEHSVENLRKRMENILDTPLSELTEMGRRGRQLVFEKYSAKTIAAQMKSLYDYLIGEGEKPDFVYLS